MACACACGPWGGNFTMLWLPLPPQCAQGRRPHLDLHGVLRLGFLGVQELNGHNHLPFALKEHHLGKVGDNA